MNAGIHRTGRDSRVNDGMSNVSLNHVLSSSPEEVELAAGGGGAGRVKLLTPGSCKPVVNARLINPFLLMSYKLPTS